MTNQLVYRLLSHFKHQSISRRKTNSMNQRIIRLAIPNIISNITVPLLGMVDLAIVGHLGGGPLLGGIAIGTAIFNLLYWNFGFLRMGTSGFTAQAYGERNFDSAFKTLFRALTLAVTIAAAILLLQVPLEWATLAVMDGSDEVEQLAAEYFYIRIWAAPATLSLYAFKGWFIGMQNARTPMYIAIVINLVNAFTSLYFAIVLDMGLSGVALGTAVAQWSGVAMAAIIAWQYYGRLFSRHYLDKLYDWASMRQFFTVNGDIFIRTVCLVIVFTFFTSASSSMGDTTLAANTLMLQLFTLFSYIMDGFAYSGEALAGRYYGSRNRAMLRRTIRGIFAWGGGTALLFTVIYALFGTSILGIFTDDTKVIAATGEYILWAIAVPIVGFTAFLMDGILVGTSHSALMRNSMILASIMFFAIYYSLAPTMGNDALWMAFILYLAGRGVFQIVGSYRDLL